MLPWWEPRTLAPSGSLLSYPGTEKPPQTGALQVQLNGYQEIRKRQREEEEKDVALTKINGSP